MKIFECAGKKYRMTPQRQAVLDVLKQAPMPPDAVWVHREVSKVMPDITMATVQRTLSLLREAGFLKESAREATDAGSSWVSDAAEGQHCQVSCVRCGRVVQLSDDACESLLAKAADITGFTTRGHHLEMYGLCPDCAQDGD